MRISLEQCRVLVPGLKDCPDDVVVKVRDNLYRLAEVAIDNWIEMHWVPNSPVGINTKEDVVNNESHL